MKRKENWVNLFNNFVEEHRHKHFVRGVNDCAIFAANAIYILTGKDLAIDFRALYKNKQQANNILNEKGYIDLEAVADDRLGSAYSLPTRAQRGDCVLVEINSEKALAIVDLSGKRAVTTGKNGLEYIKMKFWIKAWKV